MLVFAHLRKCAGTSIVEAAVDAGMRLPRRHRNGHPTGPDGHGLPGLNRMSAAQIAAIFGELIDDGVEMMAIEWDFPPFDLMPSHLGLRFFTVLREPVERFLSNYAYDVTSGFTKSRSVRAYGGEAGIWKRPNYYTRFFNGLGADDEVGSAHADAVVELLSRHFAYACFGEDLDAFLTAEVGLPIRAMGHVNRTNRLLRVLHGSRLRVSPAELEEIRAANALDLRLYHALRSARAKRTDAAAMLRR